MPVALNSQVGSRDQLDAILSRQIMSAMRVSTPGIIQSYNPIAMTCTVQPAIKGVESDGNGGMVSASLPLLVDVPLVFPSAGGCTITFPVKEGDECLLVFGDNCIDFWWQSGGVQEPVDDRQHDLSDAFAIIGPRSQARKLANISTSTLQMRTDDGLAYIELDPASHKVNIVAPGGVNVTAPLAEFSDAVTIKGLLSWMGGMVGSITDGVAARITGAIEFIGTLKSNGKNISDSHTHGGVERGGGNTDGVN
ncbi:translation initiation factor IF-2 [Erwinia sp. E602]|uniref:Gp138 family membrane-puncturing spike protein n=1 Tax=Erwinia sp. E602 TaxID=2675378 RepID=UPI001BAAB0B6|nr:Gp138 family membrane-puncturing spike protein [Erwinia sp. E602]QUG75959.1 translation initiation factor IF-2 [Erwinia sp. E602]